MKVYLCKGIGGLGENFIQQKFGLYDSVYTLNVCSVQCRRQRNKRGKSQAAPAMSAGEAIERMLVERKISTKINYDVLRDLASGEVVEGGPGHHSFPTNTAAASESLLAISKAPPTTAGRLPSLTTRKRNFSALMIEPGTISGRPPAKSVTRNNDTLIFLYNSRDL